MKKKTRIKVGCVSVPFYPWIDPKTNITHWRWSWKDASGGWKYGTRSDKGEAIEAARARCRAIAAGTLDLECLNPAQMELVRQFLALTPPPTSADLRALEAWRAKSSVPLAAVVKKWHESKVTESHGTESPHIRALKLWLDKMAAELLGPAALITSEQLADYIEATGPNPKSRRDYRARLITIWKFARTHEIFDNVEAEKLPTYRAAVSRAVAIWTPAEMSTLLRECPMDFLPWLFMAAFSGLRSQEIAPLPGTKPALRWEQVKLDQGFIDLPAASSKVRKRRLVPITPTLRKWLEYVGPPKTGLICPDPRPSKITKKLGENVGGWRKNALRHSYGTYRAAETKDLQSLALEMGTSHAMLEKHYREAVPESVSALYWGIDPSEVFKKS